MGGDTEPIEGENMRFARQHLKSVVPRLYAIYQRPRPKRSSPITYIVMEYVHGRPLSEIWSTIGDTERTKIINSLRDSLRILRSITPPDYFGSLGRTKLNDEIFSATGEHENRTTTGPFKTESDLIHALILRYRKEVGDRLHHKADFFQHVLPKTLQGDGKPVFTHGDLQRKNIIVGSGGSITIIDWQPSGWYPVWWEYVITMETEDWKDDWHHYVPRYLSEFPSHYAWYHMLCHELWY
ncbi:hypothetical protein NPX13_g490 [Xylaria arbuscula]|uniref:Aminoglycoside phosphotransferase domain-containing protein n=1 Tax=Xylaria arbuscula TaxID=114810 RepID=A0A9W8NNV2_9PEZI|nr:hypothetical protein NPX13_g490 [Xylaria arbuscula]